MQHRSAYARAHRIDGRVGQMRIAKPMLLITTPLGMIGGVYEAFRLAGGLALLMIALMAMVGAAIAMLVLTIRREKRASERAHALQPDNPGARAQEETLQ
jgi:hypothetical protein